MTIDKKKKGLRRRKFLKYSGIGIGLMIGGIYATRHQWRRMIFESAENTEALYLGSTKPNIWFQITPANDIILHSSKVEMGQGTFTGLAQIAADELEVAIERIKVVHAETNTGNIDAFATGGSMSISGLWQPMREMAATMREMLRNKAAEKLGMAADTLSIKDGVVSGGGKSMTYGEIVEGVTEWNFPNTPDLKPIKDYKFVGKPIPRVDLEAKVLGAPIFGMDATMPDMLYGSVVRPDKIDAVLKSCDSREAEKMPGVVKVVKEEDFIGVVAKSFVEAEAARRRLKVTWDITRTWQLSDLETLIKVGNGKKIVFQKEGQADNILGKEGNTIEMEFRSPIGAHAQLEPNGALASVVGDKATIIMSTQVVGITRSEVAKRLGIKAKQVNIIPTYLGGGFGRRLHTPNAVQAAVLSKAVGKPVKCFFDRKQEFQNDTFRPPTHHVMRGKLDENGNILALEHSLSSGGVMFDSALIPDIAKPILGADIGAVRGGAIQYSSIPNRQAISWYSKLPFATSFWRSLGLLANTFAIESFMDELAVKAGKNPVDFRIAHIEEDKAGKRLKAVIRAAADKAGYQDKAINGRAMGIAASTDAMSPCAHVAEVSIVDGEIKVHKVTCAFDCGIAVNPDQVRAQCEGNIIMGMSASMFEKMSIKDNKLYPTIYGAYKMALMKHAPKDIDVVLIQGDDKPGAVGEPPLGPIAAAIANAVYRLTGQRLTEMPLTLS